MRRVCELDSSSLLALFIGRRIDFPAQFCDSTREVSGARKGRAGGVRASLASLFKLQRLERVDAMSALLARFLGIHAVASTYPTSQ